jgi:hypothetical protein
MPRLIGGGTCPDSEVLGPTNPLHHGDESAVQVLVPATRVKAAPVYTAALPRRNPSESLLQNSLVDVRAAGLDARKG